MLFVICFDITDDRIRYRVVKALKGCGVRVQKSVFECSSMTEKRLLTLKDQLERLIDHTTDSVRYYRQCQGCLTDFEISGVGEAPSREDFAAV